MEIELYSDIAPYDWQLDLHNYITNYLENEWESRTNPHIITVKAARQKYGKSTATKAELIRFAGTLEGSINGYIAPAMKLANKMYDEIVSSCSQIIKSKNAVKLEITFINDSQIKFFSAEQRDNLRGHTITGLLIADESAFIKDDVFNELISPWIVVHNAMMILISTPLYRQGKFYDYFIRGLNSGMCKTFDWTSDYPPDENDLYLKEMKLSIPKLKYDCEYLGRFIDFESGVFGKFNNCFRDYEVTYNELYIGIDWALGTGNDDTVVTAINEKGEQVYVEYINYMEPGQQVDLITNMFYNKPIKKIIVEGNAIGTQYYQQLRDKNKSFKIEKWDSTNTKKREVIDMLKNSFEKEKIKMIRDDKQINQLLTFEATINPKTNIVTYNAKSGKHDDAVIALCLANKAFIEKNSGIRVSFI